MSVVYQVIPNQALRNAVSLFRQPMQARVKEKVDLPSGMTELLRVAADGEGVAAQYSAELGSTPSELCLACQFYLRTVVFNHDASDARILGLIEPVDPAILRTHKRLILKWLHPDRNHSAWENKLFLRVQNAAVRLEKTEGIGKEIRGKPRRSASQLKYVLEQKAETSHSAWQINRRLKKIMVRGAILVICLGSVIFLAMYATTSMQFPPFYFGEAN